MNEQQDLAALVTRARSGDMEAFEELVRRFQDMAVGYAYSILNDLGPAQDAAQEAFIQLYGDLPKLRAPEAFLTWFRRIIFKHCDRLRRGKRIEVVPLDEVAEVTGSVGSLTQAIEEREAAGVVQAALRALPEHERAVIILFYYQDASLKDIGEFLEESLSTIDHRLRLARQHLSERLLSMAQIELQANRPSNDPRFLIQVMDGLTQVPNDRGFSTRLQEEIEISRASRQGFGVVLFDVDYFVEFNQARGHVAGDCLLAALAKQIQPRLHASDFVARYANDMFAVIVRRSSLQKVGEEAEALRESIAHLEFRLGELLLPETRHTALDRASSHGAANENYQRGLRHLRDNELAEVALEFEAAIEQDAKHVPSIMELEFLKLRQTPGLTRLDEPFRITVSGGVAWYREGDTAEALLDRADQCLGSAKQSGRDQIRLEA